MSESSTNREKLLSHLMKVSLRTDGPFTLRSGAVSDWYLDARQTTLDGYGATLVGQAVLELFPSHVDAVGGMTMGSDPISVAVAMTAALQDRSLRAFSVRKEAKDHGVGGRIVGPVAPGDVVIAIEDTTSTGGALMEAIEAMRAFGLVVDQAVSLVDRSEGRAAKRLQARGVAFTALVTPSDLGVDE